MGSFTASLKTVGDRRGLPATINVEGGRLSIAAGEAAIGDWSLDEIRLEPTPKGYRLAAEGEQILIEMPDSDKFADVLSRESKQGSLLGNFKLPGFGSKKKTDPEPKKADTSTIPVSQNPTPPVVAEPKQRTAPAPEAPRSEEKAKRAEKKGDNVVVAFVDRTVAAAERRWSSLLPEWVFTRVMFGVVVGVLVAAVIFPGLVSTVLLLFGVLIVTFGAIAYSDDMLASKWLPGRTTPIHTLLFGVTILALGVLLAVVAG